MTDDSKANAIIKKLCENGWDAYVVGGAARDILNGETPGDFDVVTNASYEDIRLLFRNSKISVVGVSFKVCLIDGIEVSTYRKPLAGGDAFYHRNSGTANSIHEDLSRRDLTINSMAFCPHTGEIVDDFGGMIDLKNRIIRFTGVPDDRIREDPCRIIRACRFRAKFEGGFEEQTFISLKKNAPLVKKQVAPERIRLEIIKAMGYQSPGIFIDSLYEIGVLQDILPGFYACYGIDGGHHHAETIDTHLKLTGDFLSPRKPILRLAGYLHDYGKPVVASRKDGNVSFIHHELVGADLVAEEMLNLKFSTKEIDYVKALILLHMRNISETDKPKSVRKVLKALNDSNLSWKDWLQLKMADAKGNLKKAPVSKIQIKNIVMKIYRELYPEKGSSALALKDLAISGEDVMEELKINTGPTVGKILKQALEYVLDEPSRNKKNDLIVFIRKFQK